jgi:hypothetical protein
MPLRERMIFATRSGPFAGLQRSLPPAAEDVAPTQQQHDNGDVLIDHWNDLYTNQAQNYRESSTGEQAGADRPMPVDVVTQTQVAERPLLPAANVAEGDGAQMLGQEAPLPPVSVAGVLDLFHAAVPPGGRNQWRYRAPYGPRSPYAPHVLQPVIRHVRPRIVAGRTSTTNSLSTTLMQLDEASEKRSASKKCCRSHFEMAFAALCAGCPSLPMTREWYRATSILHTL